MSEPTKPGYYWAKIKSGDSWEIVEVARSYDGLMVYVTGSEDDYKLSRFTFGPEAIKPEGLE